MRVCVCVCVCVRACVCMCVCALVSSLWGPCRSVCRVSPVLFSLPVSLLLFPSPAPSQCVCVCVCVHWRGLLVPAAAKGCTWQSLAHHHLLLHYPDLSTPVPDCYATAGDLLALSFSSTSVDFQFWILDFEFVSHFVSQCTEQF